MKKDSKAFTSDVEYKKLIQECGERFCEINEMATQHGVFPYNRETVHCIQCGLTEDIAFSGKLFTYQQDDAEFKETGLQFITLDNTNERFKCPVCNTEILAPQEKE